jgi:hypothetical protein
MFSRLGWWCGWGLCDLWDGGVILDYEVATVMTTSHLSLLTNHLSRKDEQALVLTGSSYSLVLAAFISLPASSVMLHWGNPLATKKSSERSGK